MKRYSISDAEYEKSVKKAREVLKKEPGIVFAYLHGSFIEKTDFGDFDLALFIEKIPEREFAPYEYDLGKLVEQVIFYPVDVRILNNAPPAFCYAVIKKGIKLVDNNEAARVNFEMQTYQNYFDFLPFRRRYLKEAFD